VLPWGSQCKIGWRKNLAIGPADKTTFTEKCRALADEYPSRKKWQLGQALLTKSKKWSLVWRVDFIFSDANSSHRVDRIVCWENPEGKISMQIAIGQRRRL
jgi:hypothetical protein